MQKRKEIQAATDSNLAQTFVVCSVGAKPRKNNPDGILGVGASTRQNPVKNEN